MAHCPPGDSLPSDDSYAYNEKIGAECDCTLILLWLVHARTKPVLGHLIASMRHFLQHEATIFYLTQAEPGNQERLTEKIVNLSVGESSKTL